MKKYKNTNIVEFTKFDNLDDALNLQKQIKGHHEYEGFVKDNYDFASKDYGFMVTNKGDIFYIYDTKNIRSFNQSFGEKLLNKVSSTHCLHDGAFYACKIVNELNKIYFLDCPLKREDNTRKESVKNNYILTTEWVA